MPVDDDEFQQAREEVLDVLEEHHPDAEWVPQVGRQLTGLSASTDLVALLDDATRVLRLWYHHGWTTILAIDPEGFSNVAVDTAEDLGPHLREEIPDLLEQLDDRLTWVHPAYREPPFRSSLRLRGEPHPVFGEL